MIYGVLLVCELAFLVWYVYEKVKAYSLKAVLIKSVASVLFIAVGLFGLHASALYGDTSPAGAFIVLGLVCGLLGDIWLDLKYVFPKHDQLFTYAGFAVFGIGHILYIAGMLTRFYVPDALAYVLVPVGLAAVLSIGNAVLEKPMKLDYGRMKPIVIVYGFLLFSTMLISGGLALYYEWFEWALNFMFAGGILFAISDLVLSQTYFGEGHERPIDLVLNYFTYYPAQFLIATAVAFLVM